MGMRAAYVTPADVEANGWMSPPRHFLLGINGYYQPERAPLLLSHQRLGLPLQARLLAWLRDHVNAEIPRAYYRLVLGHDLHLAVWGELYARQFHAAPDDPCTGWWEDIGRVSAAKVTTAFRDFECGQLVNESPLYGDFKYHEAGTGATAEANTQTALVASTGIARSVGTQTNPSASSYQSVATIVGDTVETWTEHGLFNASSGPTMMDRSVLSPTIAMQPGDAVEFTYILSKSAEP